MMASNGASSGNPLLPSPILHNFSDISQEVFFHAARANDAGRHLIDLLGNEHSKVADDGRHCVLLEAYGYRWFRLDDLSYLLNPSEAAP